MAKKTSKLAARVRALEDALEKLMAAKGGRRAKSKKTKKAKAKKSARAGKKKAAKPARKRTKKAKSRSKKARAARPELLFQEPPPTTY